MTTRIVMLVAASLLAASVVVMVAARSYEVYLGILQEQCNFNYITNSQYQLLRNNATPEFLSEIGAYQEWRRLIGELPEAVSNRFEARLAAFHAQARKKGFLLTAVQPQFEDYDRNKDPYFETKRNISFRYTKLSIGGLLTACFFGCQQRMDLSYVLPSKFERKAFYVASAGAIELESKPMWIARTGVSCPPLPSQSWLDRNYSIDRN